MEELKAISGAELRAKSRPLVTCPSGNVYRLRRPKLTEVINTGVLPENFTAQALQALQISPPDKEPTDKDILNSEAAIRAMVTATMLEPRIVANPTADDEIAYEDLPKEDAEYINQWATFGIPESPVQTKDGEMTVGAVANFPSQERSGKPETALADSE